MASLLTLEAEQNQNYICMKCSQEFKSIHNRDRHQEFCGEIDESTDENNKKLCEPGKNVLLGTRPNAEGIVEYETAFHSRLKSFFIRLDECYDLECYLENSRGKFL